MLRASIALIAAALSACSGAGVPVGQAGRRTSRSPPAAPVRAANEGGSSEGFVALVVPPPERIRVHEGSFLMGSAQSEVTAAIEVCMAEPRGDEELCQRRFEYANEMADHEVFVSTFWIDRTEVTVERYRSCVRTGLCTELPYAAGGARFDVPELPAVLVSWYDARRFCQWAGGRLPTEAEWERAARGARGRRYPWGNVYQPFLSNHGRLSLDELDDSDGFLELSPVGSFPDGATSTGVLDMAGNAAEWVADYYAPAYLAASVVNPRGPDSGEEKVVRGGSYLHPRASLRCAARGHAPPDERRSWRGFRCAYDER